MVTSVSHNHNRPWALHQRWHNLLFVHWPVDPAMLAPLIPPGLTLETFDGQAWVGVVPFWMSQVRPRGLPSLPGISRFPEINVRTYVTAEGQPGVWFFSLDAGNRLAVTLARQFFRLPYYHARFAERHAGDSVTYASQRIHPHAPLAAFVGQYAPTGPVFHASPGSLDHWLTERYCLYTAGPHGAILRGKIRHTPWPLQPAVATITRNTMAEAAGITLPDIPPLLHYAHRLDVVCWLLEQVRV